MEDGLAVMCLFFLAFLIGGIIGGCTTSNSWEKEAIKHGYGYYHPETSEFTWKEMNNDEG